MRALQASEMLNSHCCQWKPDLKTIQYWLEHLTPTCEVWPSWVDGASLLTLPVPAWMKMSENGRISPTYTNKAKGEKHSRTSSLIVSALNNMDSCENLCKTTVWKGMKLIPVLVACTNPSKFTEAVFCNLIVTLVACFSSKTNPHYATIKTHFTE